MNDPRHNPDPLGAATDRCIQIIVALLPPRKRTLALSLGMALGDLFAELIGRAAAQSASIITPTLRKVEDLEKRERLRSERIVELERTVNGRVDVLWRHYEAMPDINEAVFKLAQDVEQLKQRQVGDE